MTRSPSQSAFSSSITRIAVAQICQSVGYNAAQTSALETLADIAARYMVAIAQSAAASASSGGRTQSNIFDIVIALEDLGSVQGFIGAPNIFTSSHCLISSSILKEIMGSLFYSEEIPFASPIPRKIWPETRINGNGVNLRHVPRWLPDMPVMDKMGVEIERNGEEKFGGGFVGQESNQRREEKENGKEKGIELRENRGKVRFRIGMGGGRGGGGIGNRGFGMEMKNGVFNRGGGIGKRILCENLSDSDGNEEDGNRKRVVKIPR